MAEYNMEHTGAELDEAIQAVLDGYRDVTPVTARASDVRFGRVIVTPEGLVTGTFQGVVPPVSWQKSVTGDPAEVTDGMAGWPLHGLVAKINPIQAGNGTPSPDNVRPITGHSGVIVTQNGETAVSVSFSNEPGVVYGGTVDLRAGVLTVESILTTYDGTESGWTRRTNNNPNGTVFNHNTPVTLQTWSDIANFKAIANWMTKPESAGYTTAGANTFFYGTGGGVFTFVWGLPNRGSTVDEWKAALAAEPLQIWAPLAEPVTYSFAPQEMPELLSGTNTFVCNTGEITVGYYSMPEAN